MRATDRAGRSLDRGPNTPPGPPDGWLMPELADLGRYTGPATLILSSLAGGAKHGYALTKDVEQFSGVRLSPGTLYAALGRLVDQKLIEPVPSDDERRRPYRITAIGSAALQSQLSEQRRVADLGLRRLKGLVTP